MGIPRFWVLDPFRPQAPHQHFAAKGGNFGPPSLGFCFTGPPTCDDYRQYYSCSLYQQTGWNPFIYPVTSRSGSVPMATGHSGQTHSGLSKRDSRPSILAEPTHNNRMESQPQNSDPDLRDLGNPNSGHVCHSPQHASSPVSEPRALVIDALSGEVDVHVSTVPLYRNHTETQDHPGG